MADKAVRFLTVTSDAGLCNRLRVLLSGMAIAEASARAFAMLWQPNVACGSAFADLFENAWDVRGDTPFDQARAIDLTIVAWNQFPDLVALESPELFVTHWGWLYQPARYASHQTLEVRARTLIQELTPVASVRQRVREFQNKFFRAKMIGAHLRRGDMLPLRPDSTTNLAAVMQQIDIWLDAEPDAGILLCTDDGARNPYTGRATARQDVRAQFLQRYGTRVVCTEPATLDRAAPAAIQDALTDLWLLRATDFFVGTVGSSFSELAVLGRAIPFAQTAGSSPQYRVRAGLFERTGIAALLTRLAHDEFGRVMPYTCLRHRYLRRARIRLTRWFAISTFRRNT